MLTDEQRAAVESSSAYLGVIAGAGSGKTTTLVERIRYLLRRGVEPQEIVAITFTRRAADEIRSRLGDIAKRCYIGTFHQIAYRLMKDKPRVLSEQEADGLLKTCITDGKSVSYWRKKVDASADLPTVRAYRSQLAIRGEIDYHGLLEWLLIYSKLWYPRHVIVDEAQDNEPIQWAIIDRLVENSAHCFIVGDENQCIYSWRNADPQDFLVRAMNRVHISQSFRIPTDVCDLANSLSEKAGCDTPKLRTTNTKLGLSIEDDEVDAVLKLLDTYEPEDIAVLTRTNTRAQEAISALKRNGVEVSTPIERETPYLDILRGIAYPSQLTVEDAEKFLPGMAVAGRIPELIQFWIQSYRVKTVGDALEHIILSEEFEDERNLLNNFFADLPIRDAVNELTLASQETRRTPGVTVCTTHQAKGLEWLATVVAFDAGGFNDEAMRVRYVAVTRCKEKCVVIRTDPLLTELALRFGAVEQEILTPF
jgi:superfamily I DNA/RNA helicase